MSRVGEKLRLERERRDTTLDAFSTATKIEPGYLRALEGDEIDALPGPAFGKFYIRVYAEALGFDPEPLIAEYEEELLARRRRELEEKLADPETAEPVAETDVASDEELVDGPAISEDAVVATPDAPTDTVEQHEAPSHVPPEPAAPEIRRSIPTVRWRGALILASVSVLVAAIWLLATRSDGETAVSAGDSVAALVEAGPPDPQPEPEPTLPPTPAETTPASSPGRIRIEEFGVGTGIVNRRLEGRGDRFTEGSVVWFATRVLGGKTGESVRHVWLHEGRTMQTVELRLGGPHWRTHSRKTLQAPGSWSVEARDEADRVLARAEFRSLPKGS